MKSSQQNIEHNCAACNARAHSVFSVIEPEHIADLNAHKSCTVYKKGQLIFSQNGLPLGLFCVNSGKIKLSTAGPDGKEQILRLVKGGDILGYRALISDDRYHCNAIALEDCSICIVDKNFFKKLAAENPKLNAAIFKKISDDLKKAEEHIVSLSQKNVRERMAEALLFFKATYGFEPDQQTLSVQFSREEIADFVGTSTESAIRLLSEFNNDKIIELIGKRIKILNIERLSKTANLLY